MSDNVASEILIAVREIRDLILVVAEPAIAARDQKIRGELRRIVGKGDLKAKAIFLMDGTRTQSAIQQQAGIAQGNLSTLVKQLKEGKLLSGDIKKPKLAISVPANFFENGAKGE